MDRITDYLTTLISQYTINKWKFLGNNKDGSSNIYELDHNDRMHLIRIDWNDYYDLPMYIFTVTKKRSNDVFTLTAHAHEDKYQLLKTLYDHAGASSLDLGNEFELYDVFDKFHESDEISDELFNEMLVVE
jgi:spore germination protein YaaH